MFDGSSLPKTVDLEGKLTYRPFFCFSASVVVVVVVVAVVRAVIAVTDIVPTGMVIMNAHIMHSTHRDQPVHAIMITGSTASPGSAGV